MRALAGPESHIHFTNLSDVSVKSLSAIFQNSNDETLARASCHNVGVLDLIKQHSAEISALAQVCLLDPKAEAALAPDDGDGRFRWFLFGVSAIRL
jgi:hypothetical protein